MMKLTQKLLWSALVLFCLVALFEARPQNAVAETNQDLDTMDTDGDNVRGSYYDLPAVQAYYANSIPAERLQMLYPQYRSNSYLRSPSTWGGANEFTKRQVRYRQCYFNPISCFKK